MNEAKLAWLLRRSQAASRPADRWAHVLGTSSFLIAMTGLALSLVTAWRNDIRTQAAEHQQFIRETYASYLEINKFLTQQPEIAHVFVAAADYPAEVKQVEQAFRNAPADQRAKMRLREEAFAYYLFTCFERFVY